MSEVRRWTVGTIRLRMLKHEPLPPDETQLVEAAPVIEALKEARATRGLEIRLQIIQRLLTQLEPVSPPPHGQAER